MHALINEHEYHLCDTYAVLVVGCLALFSNSVLTVYMRVLLRVTCCHVTEPVTQPVTHSYV